jgi:hypothetical protein
MGQVYPKPLVEARHLPAPSVWYVWIVRFPKAAMVPRRNQRNDKRHCQKGLTLDETTLVKSVSMDVDLEMV